MRKSKKEKMKLRSLNEMLKNPVVRFQMLITNRAMTLIKMGESDCKVCKIIADDQKALADRIREDLSDLDLTDKAFQELILTDEEIREIIKHAHSIIKEMEAKK